MDVFFVKVLPDEQRVIARKTSRGIQRPKSATVEGKRVNLTAKRSASEQHALCRTLNAALRATAEEVV